MRSKPVFKSFGDVFTYMGNKTEKKLPSIRHTYLRREGGKISLYYHETAVVIYYKNMMRLFTDGYHTATTKKRINDFSVARVYVENGVWWILDKENPTTPVPFFEGVVIGWDGILFNSFWTVDIKETVDFTFFE